MTDEKIGADMLQEMLATFVKAIEIDTNFTEKPMVIADPFKSSGEPGTADAIMKLAQPSITFRFEGGGSKTIAPAGKPSRKAEIGGYKNAALVGGGLALVLGGLLIYKAKKGK